jgi:signal transduction histidine kinase
MSGMGRSRTEAIAVGLGLGALAVGETLVRATVERGDSDPSVQFVLLLGLIALATTLPLAFRPAAGAGAGVVGAAITAPIAAAGLVSLVPLHRLTLAGAAGVVVALYLLGRSGSLVLTGALALPFLVLGVLGPGTTGGDQRALVVGIAVAAPVAGWAGAARWSRDQAHAHDAARRDLAGRLVAHTARGERARISRELHDVVAHHISMIAVQAETARLTTPGLPDAGEQRLSAIGATARAALTEMRRLLGVLREDIDATPDAPPDRRPQPGLGELNELVDEARDATGSGTRLILRGAPVPLDPGVELATYRIVQEALTNARRHAPGAAIDVELHFAEPGLRVRVRDNGPGPSPSPSPAADSAEGGHGLLGMRERALAVGGTLEVGADPGGGFLVTACLPGKEPA